MASPIASTSTASTTRTSKNPGLTLNLTREVSGASSPSAAKRFRLSAVHSLSNTPELEPDWNDDDDFSVYGDEDGAQYVYIAADSPFYRGPSSPRTSSLLSFSGFPFACDALAEADPPFAQSPRALFDDEPESEFPNSNRVVIVNAELAGNMDSQSISEWNLIEADGAIDQVKPTPTTVERDNEELRQSF